MSNNKSFVFIVLIIGITIVAIITVPGFYKYFYRAGTGHAFGKIAISNNLSWDKMSESERAPYLSQAKSEGVKCATFMILGQFIPLYLFLLLTIMLLKKSITKKYRTTIIFSFFVVWIIGLLFLSIGSSYWGQAIPFPESLGPSIVIYLVVALFFAVVIGVFKLIQRLIYGKKYNEI